MSRALTSLKNFVEYNEKVSASSRKLTLTPSQFEELLVLWRLKTSVDKIHPAEVKFELVRIPSEILLKETVGIRQEYLSIMEELLGMTLTHTKGNTVLYVNSVGDMKAVMGFGHYTIEVKYRKLTNWYYIRLPNYNLDFTLRPLSGYVGLLPYMIHVAGHMDVAEYQVRQAYNELIKRVDFFNKKFVQTLPEMEDTTGVPARIDLKPVQEL